MQLSIVTVTPLLATVLYGVLFITLAVSTPRTRLRGFFSVYLLAMFIWSGSAFMVVIGANPFLFWFRMMLAASFASMLAIFYFTQTLFAKRSAWSKFVFAFGVMAIGLCLSTNWVVKDAHLSESGELFYQFNFLIGFLAVPGSALFVYSLIELIRGYRRSEHLTQRNRLRYLILGFSIIILASSFNFTELGKYPIDVAAYGVAAVLIAYAILRHQLLDIQIVIRYGLLYTLTTAIIGTFYFIVISLAISLVEAFTQGKIIVISIFVAFITSFLIAPFQNRLQPWIDRLFYREKYNAGLMLQRLSTTTTSLLDLNKLSSLIISEITQTLHADFAIFYAKQNENDDYRPLAQQNIGKQLYTTRFRSDHPIITWMSRQGIIISKNDLGTTPIFKSLWEVERNDLETIHAELFVPICIRNELVAFLIMGPKRSTQPYSQDDRLLLSTLANQTAVAIENAELYDELEKTFIQTITTLANAIDLRDTYTSGHSQRIAALGSETARNLKCSPAEISDVYWGGLLHDIGKIGIPDSILKKPDKLDDSEWEIIRQHTVHGANLISPIKRLANIAPLIEYSHERFDGLGYPYGIKGEEIPLGARIIAVVDSFSAMIDERPYKQAYSTGEAVAELKKCSGTMYDPKVVEYFVRTIEKTHFIQ